MILETLVARGSRAEAAVDRFRESSKTLIPKPRDLRKGFAPAPAFFSSFFPFPLPAQPLRAKAAY